MKKKIVTILFTTLVLLTFSACSKSTTDTSSTTDASTTTATNGASTTTTSENTTQADTLTHQTISAVTAKEMIDKDDSIIILDVRTKDEFDEGHIKNALLLPDTEVEDKAQELLPDKDATILIYCRSGRRSALSATKLDELGYTNVYDFGGIIDWPYDIVTE